MSLSGLLIVIKRLFCIILLHPLRPLLNYQPFLPHQHFTRHNPDLRFAPAVNLRLLSPGNMA